MSEIPFVNALGDAIEHAVSRRRSRLRRRIAFGAVAFAVAASGVAAASGVFESPAGPARHDQHRLLHPRRPQALRRRGDRCRHA